RGFVSDPEVMFLDEPTLGMDVHAARTLRAFVAQWVRERPGRTVLLTTHYMAEAEELCDRIAIIDRGRVLALDSVPGLRRRVQGGDRPRARRRGHAVSASLPGPATFRSGTLTFGESVRLNLRAAAARAYVRVVGSLREISWFFSDGVLPNLGMVAYVLLYRA